MQSSSPIITTKFLVPPDFYRPDALPVLLKMSEHWREMDEHQRAATDTGVKGIRQIPWESCKMEVKFAGMETNIT